MLQMHGAIGQSPTVARGRRLRAEGKSLKGLDWYCTIYIFVDISVFVPIVCLSVCLSVCCVEV